MDRSRVGVIIPALNEAKTITSIVSKAVEYGFPIVVDDGSLDNTGVNAFAAGALVVRHDKNSGYDAALNSGFRRADELDCAYIVTLDADGQHDPSVLQSFIHALDNGAEVVVGIRDRQQRIAEHIFAWISHLKWGILDPLCGMKAYRMTVYREFGHFDSYGSIGTELMIYAAKSDKKIVQLSLKTRERMDSPRFDSRFSANIRIFRALWIGLKKRPV